ncbi:MAG: serine/threonine-protein kinase RsbW [Mycobacterium sp.]|nr:serine/threonine-protein kinase RsbW [Mycobacterium sp.]
MTRDSVRIGYFSKTMNDLASAPDGAAGPGGEAPTFRQSHSRADPDTVAQARDDFGAWLRRCCPPAGAVHHDVLLAVNEALSNAVEHAYPDVSGSVDCFARYDPGQDTLTVAVQDYGQWRPPAPVGDPHVSSRGRGLVLMRALADRADVEVTEAGTRVDLTWHHLTSRRTCE